MSLPPDTELAVRSCVEIVRGAIPSTVISDRLVRGYLNAAAEERPALMNAFKHRDKNPAALDKELDLLRAELAEDIMKLTGKDWR